MCPVCGTPLALATEAPQAQDERAYIQELIAQCKSKDEVKQALVAEFGDTVLALPGDQGDDDLGDVLVYVVPALGLLLAASGIAFAVLRWRRRTRGGDGAGGAARSRAPTAPASRTTWTATSCDRPGHRRRHGLRGLRRRLHLVRVAVRAAARARLPLHHLGRLVRRHPGGPRAHQGAGPGAAVLPRLHRHVRRPRDDRHGPRPDAPGQPRDPAADLREW